MLPDMRLVQKQKPGPLLIGDFVAEVLMIVGIFDADGWTVVA